MTTTKQEIPRRGEGRRPPQLARPPANQTATSRSSTLLAAVLPGYAVSLPTLPAAPTSNRRWESKRASKQASRVERQKRAKQPPDVTHNPHQTTSPTLPSWTPSLLSSLRRAPATEKSGHLDDGAADGVSALWCRRLSLSLLVALLRGTASCLGGDENVERERERDGRAPAGLSLSRPSSFPCYSWSRSWSCPSGLDPHISLSSFRGLGSRLLFPAW
ncbi:hypothetical protein QBC39DRAFT_348500 [Podospora conica]|nr:hypothetical protein QBC39DRAFT_348500 [Schizothecium conicum]